MTPEQWLARFERASWSRRALMLGGGAVRAAAKAVDRVVERAADITLDAHDAFKKELDPNVTEAKILEETEHPDRADG